MSQMTANTINKTIQQHPDKHIWKEASIKHFERWSNHYDRDIINILLFIPSYRRVLGRLRHWLRRGIRCENILDIGCGTGSLAMMVLRQNPTVKKFVGLDMSENMIEHALAKRQRLGLQEKVDFVVGDAEHLPFDDNSFDVVTCCNSFHHYPHQDIAVAQIRRVLKPGGRAIIIDGSRDDPIGHFIFDICVTRVEKHVHHCSAARFGRLLEDADFRQIDQRLFGVCPPAIMNVATK